MDTRNDQLQTVTNDDAHPHCQLCGYRSPEVEECKVKNSHKFTLPRRIETKLLCPKCKKKMGRSLVE